MLGQKEICGLIIILCCYLAHSYPTRATAFCNEYLLEDAEKLVNAVDNTYGISEETNANKQLRDELHNNNSCSGRSIDETHGIIKAFQELFEKLRKSFEAPVNKALQQVLDQQKNCLKHWNVSSPVINITYKSPKTTFLFEAAQCYRCLVLGLKNN